MNKIDVHNYDYQLDVQKRLLEKSSMKPENRRTIQDFVNFCNVDTRIGKARTIKYMYTLRRMAELIDKPFGELTERDINELLTKLQDYKTAKGRPYSVESMNDFRKSISKFWRWLYFDEYSGDAPPSIRRMKIKSPKENKEPEVYTKEEIKALIDGMRTIRDKAFFSCLYDLQCRVSELLSRQIKHVRHTEDGDIQILIEADKTSSSHWETLFESVGQFNTWLRLHPAPNNPEAPLWTIQRKNGNIVPLSYALVRKLFVRTCQRQNIRRLKIHTLRKSKATHDLADGVPITYIETRGSWKKGSRALQDCYLAVMQKDKDNAYRKKYGMAVNNGHSEIKELKRCSRCESIIEKEAKFCARCGMPTDMKTAIEMKNIESKLPSMIDKDMLSELVKKLVLEELANKVKRKS